MQQESRSRVDLDLYSREISQPPAQERWALSRAGRTQGLLVPSLLPQTHPHQQSQANSTASKQGDVGAGSHPLLPALQEGQ